MTRPNFVYIMYIQLDLEYMGFINLPDAVAFQWDEANEEKIWVKHRVSKEEAEDTFYDTKRIFFDDIKHSKQEKRYIILGKTKKRRVLFVAFTLRNKKIRIVSARPINRKEVALYEKANHTT